MAKCDTIEDYNLYNSDVDKIRLYADEILGIINGTLTGAPEADDVYNALNQIEYGLCGIKQMTRKISKNIQDGEWS